jgi:hypothetical protein
MFGKWLHFFSIASSDCKISGSSSARLQAGILVAADARLKAGATHC